MRAVVTAIIIGAGAVLAGSAQAGLIAVPVRPSRSLYQTVADQVMTVVGNAVNLRAQPNTKAAVLTKLNKGATVTAVGTSGSWTHVKYKNLDGYISTRFLK